MTRLRCEIKVEMECHSLLADVDDPKGLKDIVERESSMAILAELRAITEHMHNIWAKGKLNDDTLMQLCVLVGIKQIPRTHVQRKKQWLRMFGVVKDLALMAEHACCKLCGVRSGHHELEAKAGAILSAETKKPTTPSAEQTAAIDSTCIPACLQVIQNLVQLRCQIKAELTLADMWHAPHESMCVIL